MSKASRIVKDAEKRRAEAKHQMKVARESADLIKVHTAAEKAKLERHRTKVVKGLFGKGKPS